MGIIGTHRFKIPWWYQFLFLPNNIGYHYEHHLYPSIPFYHLPGLREVLHPKIPIMRLNDLYDIYENSPRIPSGSLER